MIFGFAGQLPTVILNFPIAVAFDQFELDFNFAATGSVGRFADLDKDGDLDTGFGFAEVIELRALADGAQREFALWHQVFDLLASFAAFAEDCVEDPVDIVIATIFGQVADDCSPTGECTCFGQSSNVESFED